MESLIFLKRGRKVQTLLDNVEFYEKEDTYGFKTERKPPPIKDMESFEREFYDIARNIVFRDDDKYGGFQKELKKDLTDMKKSKGVIIAADKSSNFYTCDKETYKKLVL